MTREPKNRSEIKISDINRFSKTAVNCRMKTNPISWVSGTPPGAQIVPDSQGKERLQNFLYLNRPVLPGALDRHFGISNSTAIMGETPLRWTPSQQQGHRIKDLMVAFDIDRDLAVNQKGYSIRGQGKPPDFVLEIASVNTGFQDYTGKRALPVH